MAKRTLLLLCLILGVILGCGSPQCTTCGLTPGCQYGAQFSCNGATYLRIADDQGCISYPQPSCQSCASVEVTTVGSCFNFFSSPNVVDLLAPPGSFTVSGSGISNAYAMPKVQYVDDSTGTLIGSQTAYAVAGDGTWLQAACPDLSSVYSGSFTITVWNMDGASNYYRIGLASVRTWDRDPPPPPDPGGGGGGGGCSGCELIPY